MSRSKASGLSAALGHEQFGLELTAERLGPNGVSIRSDLAPENTSLYLRIEALKMVSKNSLIFAPGGLGNSPLTFDLTNV